MRAFGSVNCDAVACNGGPAFLIVTYVKDRRDDAVADEDPGERFARGLHALPRRQLAWRPRFASRPETSKQPSRVLPRAAAMHAFLAQLDDDCVHCDSPTCTRAVHSTPRPASTRHARVGLHESNAAKDRCASFLYESTTRRLASEFPATPSPLASTRYILAGAADAPRVLPLQLFLSSGNMAPKSDRAPARGASASASRPTISPYPKPESRPSRRNSDNYGGDSSGVDRSPTEGSGPRTQRQQYSACGACRMRRWARRGHHYGVAPIDEHPQRQVRSQGCCCHVARPHGSADVLQLQGTRNQLRVSDRTALIAPRHSFGRIVPRGTLTVHS
jgi:hypothetical protein